MQMTLPALLHVRPLALARFLPAPPPHSPRQVQLQRLLSAAADDDNGGDGILGYQYRATRRPAIGNLEDAIGAAEKWCKSGSRAESRDRWPRWASRAPLILAYSIFVLTYVPFVVWVGHDQLYSIHRQGWRFAGLLVMYHTLLSMAVLSLYRASTTSPGTPDHSYAQPSNPRRTPALHQDAFAAPVNVASSCPSSPVMTSPVPGLRRRDSDTSRPPPDAEYRTRSRSGSISFASGTSAGTFPRIYQDERSSDNVQHDDDVPLSAFRRASLSSFGISYLPSEGTTTITRVQADEIKSPAFHPASLQQISYPPSPRVYHPATLGRENRLLRRWCAECQGWKPPRCHHCRTCGICVLKMDHHCLWLNACIGFNNHKPFLLFLMYATVLSGFVAEETAYVVYRWLDGGQVVDITDFRPVANLLLFLIAITFFLAIGSFFCFHVYLAANNRTTLENLRPCLPPAALIEPTSATPIVRTNSPSPHRPSSPDHSTRAPAFHDPPPAYTAISGARNNRLQRIQMESTASRSQLDTTPFHWQWRWKSDHLLTRNERKTVRWVVDNVNIYDLGDAWRNLVGVLDGPGNVRGALNDEGMPNDKDLEMGVVDGTSNLDGGISLGRCAKWLWPTTIHAESVSDGLYKHSASSSQHTTPPGHDFPISTRAIDIIRAKTYGLRSRRRVALRPTRVASDPGEDGAVRSSNEYEFESEDGYEGDEMEEYGII